MLANRSTTKKTNTSGTRTDTLVFMASLVVVQEPAAQSPKISKQDISQAAALFTNEEVEKPDDQEVPTEEPDSLNEPAQVRRIKKLGHTEIIFY